MYWYYKRHFKIKDENKHAKCNYRQKLTLERVSYHFVKHCMQSIVKVS